MIKAIGRVLLKAAKFTIKIITFPIVYPVTLAIKSIKRKLKRRKQQSQDFPGVYIVSNNQNTVKIGRSKQVRRRLKSYRGYQHDGKDIPTLMILRCKKHRELEALMHQFATEHGLYRQGRTEVFICKNKQRFLSYVADCITNRTEGFSFPIHIVK